MVKTCERCGKEFDARMPHVRFCSYSCARYATWENRSRAESIQYTCKTCGKAFCVLKRDHRHKEGTEIKYCSTRCAGVGIRTGRTQACPQCGKQFYTTKRTFCSVECARTFRKAARPRKAVIPKVRIPSEWWYENGYKVIRLGPRRFIKEHIQIMQNHIGRKLQPGEVVHHINGIKDDNRIENLMLMTAGQHSSYHRQAEKAGGKHLFGGYHNN